jgi:hypothetical protein
MTRFDINAPIATREPNVTVDAGLPIGRHRFRLEVIDAVGSRSTPNDAIVEVQRIVIDPGPAGPSRIDPTGPIIRPVAPVGPTGPPVRPAPRRPRARRKKETP